MANLDLSGVLTNVGAPFLRKIIEGTLPPPWNAVGGRAVEVLASALGVPAEEGAIVARYRESPEEVTPIIQSIEADPSVILAGVEQQRETNTLLLAEMKEPIWTWAWRPMGMYGLGFLWFWNIVILHLLNWWWKSQLPQTDLGTLFQLSVLYMGLYMGGHTVKDGVTKFAEALSSRSAKL